jgi:branched-chain amino acid transport system permease protein
MFEVVLNGLILGGMYGLIALGLNLQYGIARMLNLSYGEFFTAGAFASFFAITLYRLNPLLGLAASVPVSFVANWLIYRVLLLPLIRRAPNQDALDGDVVLCTFGLLFVFQGFEQVYWGGNVRGYYFLATPVHFFGARLPENRLLAFAAAMILGGVLILVMRKTRFGTALRAIAIDPIAAGLTGIDVFKLSALAFALGGALVAISGALVSTFIASSASSGIVYTLKALIVIIVGGPGRMAGAIAAGLLLGLAEQVGGYLVDPGLTLAINYAILILVLLIKPTGLFARG